MLIVIDYMSLMARPGLFVCYVRCLYYTLLWVKDEINQFDHMTFLLSLETWKLWNLYKIFL